ncbi:MAG: protein-L-isoaspartate O-methyltransferase [Rhodospirillaceae bacterium]|nr:protein-L-isoaspartate O-methyltransferase [Rhodospirillaceae bacterium]|tara:strand:+ start:3767 stop:4420 length:654 start_codon:yes stop_codon:yes gene_type:complete
MNIFNKARESMILSQLQTNNVTNERLLKAMRDIPREVFVPEEKIDLAYIDGNIEIYPMRYMLSPMFLAKMIQEARILDSDVVLDIACLTGYSTAVLSKLAATVIGIEPSSAYVEKANKILSDLQIDNAAVLLGDISNGWLSQGPYNVILINGSINLIPNKLIDQLSNGGRLICVENINNIGKAVCYLKQPDSFGRRVLFDASIPLVPGNEEKAEFIF